MPFWGYSIVNLTPLPICARAARRFNNPAGCDHRADTYFW